MPLSGTSLAAILLTAIAAFAPQSLPSSEEIDRILGVSESDEPMNERPASSRPRQRARTRRDEKRKAPNRTKGCLKDLLKMPPEIFSEIARHLTAPDLLSLARSTKFFRSLLLSRSSTPIWDSAINNVPGLPPCPPDLSAPHYVSLIYSKTCSECGARVLRRMDTRLRVRLCGSCREMLLFELSDTNQLHEFVPISRDILRERDGISYCLEKDFFALKNYLQSPVENDDDEAAFEDWMDNRRKELEERYKHSDALDEFLDQMEEDRADELQRLKDERMASIEERLNEDGWDSDDMTFPNETFAEWKELVLQPKPLTDRIWSNLYPKLIPLLKQNRERNKQIEQQERLQERQRVIHDCMGVVQRAYPPLAEVSVYWDDGPDAEPVTTKLDVPFPTTTDALGWHSIKTLAEVDYDSDTLETNFFDSKRNIGERLGEWMQKVHDDVLAIWDQGYSNKSKDAQSAEKNQTSLRRSTRKGKEPLDATCGTDLPRRTMVFTEPGGLVCTSPDELSDEIRLLLRADTVFRTSSVPCYYPDIIPTPVLKWVFTDIGEAPRFGDAWDPHKVTRDNEVSDVARKLLQRMGNPDVTYPELKALGEAFLCMRCKWEKPVGWLDFVSLFLRNHVQSLMDAYTQLKHYSTELSRWSDGYYNLSVRDDADEITFNNAHDLDPSNPEPIQKILNPAQSAEMAADRTKPLMPCESDHDSGISSLRCLMCETLGVDAVYSHRWTLDFEGSPMISHLKDVHGIAMGRYAVHYGILRRNAVDERAE
ncbi:hypothetical protein FRC12_010502 [Ceratobasidium sp. 428]|nr:hypothetical protein FRC12_010502 [Ceratobasidium sp. 428]